MKILCIRCAQGVVLFRIDYEPTIGGRTVRCLTDNAVQNFRLSKPADVGAMLAAMAQKAIQLRGQIQQVFEVTI